MPKNPDQFYDWRWRLNNLYKIVDKQGNLTNLTENSIQRAINDDNAKRKMILKYRQGGVTTNEVLKQADFVFFGQNKNACILAHDQRTIEKIFRIPKLAYDKLDPQFKPEIDRGGGSKYEMRFPDINTSIYCALEVRGGTTHWLHISEAAFADPSRIKASLESVPIDGIITFESTANGMGNYFYKRWIDRDLRLKKMFFPWFIHKEYVIPSKTKFSFTEDEKHFIKKVKKNWSIKISSEQILFRRSKQNDLKELYQQEYPEDEASCFLTSGNSPIDAIRVTKLIADLKQPLKQDDWYEIYEEYDPKERYVIGADTAEGTRSDYSVASVFKISTMDQVAQIRANTWKPREFAETIQWMAKKYTRGSRQWPKLAVERNNHGHAVILQLENDQYPNLFMHTDGKVGWMTNKVTRPVMIDTFIEGLESNSIRLRSNWTLNECLTLIDNNGKIEATAGEHDDCIIADSIAIQCAIKESPSDLYDKLSTKIFM